MSLRQKLNEIGVSSTQLDSIVQDAAERQASRINNEGLSEQLEYLEKVGLSEDEILFELGIGVEVAANNACELHSDYSVVRVHTLSNWETLIKKQDSVGITIEAGDDGNKYAKLPRSYQYAEIGMWEEAGSVGYLAATPSCYTRWANDPSGDESSWSDNGAEMADALESDM